MVIQTWRRAVRIFITALLLGLPFLTIRGESALRFDIPTLRLYFFGSEIWMEEFFTVLIALLFFVFLLILLTILFGRFWCGWLCPQTIICEDTLFFDKLKRKKSFKKIAAYSAVLFISFLIGANFLWYFISPYKFIPDLLSFNLSGIVWGVWIAFSLKVFFIFTFIRRDFCGTICPYAKLQDVLYDEKTLIITFDEKRKAECLKDGQCVRECPIHMDIRKGTNALCINCGRCVDKCAEVMCKRGKESIIGYRFGTSGEKKRILARPHVISIMGLTLMFFAFLIYLIAIRSAFDLSIEPNFKFKPQVTHNMIINSFLVKMKNMKEHPVDVNLSLSGIEGIHFMNKPDVLIKAGEVKNLIVYIASPASSIKDEQKNISHLVTFSAHITNPSAAKQQNDKHLTVTKSVAFLLPVKG